jgi:AcrR family transcriptional regulator
MSRTRADDYDEKKRVILDKAATLIARRGFDQATMQDVAKACGASKSHVYHYFPSKEELLYAIVHDHITRQVAELERIVSQPTAAELRFQQFVDSFMRVAASERDQHIILMNDLKYLPRAELRSIQAMEIRLTEMLNRLLQEINPQAMGSERMRHPAEGAGGAHRAPVRARVQGAARRNPQFTDRFFPCQCGSRSTFFMILPAPDRGSASRNSTLRGHL